MTDRDRLAALLDPFRGGWTGDTAALAGLLIDAGLTFAGAGDDTGLRAALERLQRIHYKNPKAAGCITCESFNGRKSWPCGTRLIVDAALASVPADPPRDEELDAYGPLLWWCPAWGTLNAKRYHGNDGPCADTNCGKVAYRRARLASEDPSDG